MLEVDFNPLSTNIHLFCFSSPSHIKLNPPPFPAGCLHKPCRIPRTGASEDKVTFSSVQLQN